MRLEYSLSRRALFIRYKGGVDRLGADCQEAGVNGFIMVDLPVEEAGEVLDMCNKYALSFVPLLAPTSTVMATNTHKHARAHTHSHTHKPRAHARDERRHTTNSNSLTHARTHHTNTLQAETRNPKSCSTQHAGTLQP
jgi:tryptophan synthase alpha subunit